MSFRMPAEWEPHAATWLAWPHQHSDWPDKFEPIPWVYGEIVRHLTRFEPVRILVADEAFEQDVREMLECVGADLSVVSFHHAPTDRSWVRDFGPIYVRDGDARHILDWGFNAWAKYPNWQSDDAIPASVARWQNLPTTQPTWNGHRVILEGGAIDVNGSGLMLTTEECLLSDDQQRNPSLTRADYEGIFTKYLGITKTLWLGRGIVGDDTHGHVDDLARFVAPNVVVTVVESDPKDANFAPLRENEERLRAYGIEVVKLPMPRPLSLEGQRLPASYANFYIANGVILVPTFNDPSDRVALGTLAELFPDREVIGIHAVDLVWGLGTLHCLSQQEPAV